MSEEELPGLGDFVWQPLLAGTSLLFPPRRLRVLLMQCCFPQRVSSSDLSVSAGCVDRW